MLQLSPTDDRLIVQIVTTDSKMYIAAPYSVHEHTCTAIQYRSRIAAHAWSCQAKAAMTPLRLPGSPFLSGDIWCSRMIFSS